MSYQPHPELLTLATETAPKKQPRPIVSILHSWLHSLLRLLDNWIVDQGRQIQYEQDLEKESGYFWGGPLFWYPPYHYRRYL